MVFLAPAMKASITAAANPIKPLLRRATLSGTVRKADEAGLDDDLLSDPPSPNKKARVTFSDKVDMKVMEDYQVKGRSLDSVRGEVKRALQSHMRGDSEGYDMIKEVFSPERDEEEEDAETVDIKSYVLALTTYASSLDKGCSDLVKSMLGCEWMGRDESFVKIYVQFLGNLASAQGAYVGMVLGMLVTHFYGVKLSSGRLPGCPDASRDQLASRIHLALKYVLRLIPSASGILSPILSARFPAPEDSKKEHIAYIHNLVRLIEYAPELQSDVFALITDRLVKIDVQMQIDLDELDDEVVESLAISAFNTTEDDGNDSESDADSVTSDEDLPDDSKRIKEVRENVGKMDSILDLLFGIYDARFENPSSSEAVAMYDTILRHFINIILPTYRSRHTQFLIFHFAQTSEEFVDNFAGTCVQLAFEKSRPAVLRQSAAAYLASFVARGAHVERHVVRTVFQLIGTQLDAIRTDNELTCRGPDLKRYSTYYAVTQALLYIFCFRWRDLLEDMDILEDDDPLAFMAQDLVWIPGIKDTLHRNIYSKLNPLKICSPLIVNQFAKTAQSLGIMYVYSLLETNKRIRLSQFSSGWANGALRDTGNGNNDERWHQLDAYFPFDPYQLPTSKKWVEDDYNQWKVVPGEVPEAVEEEDSSDDEDDGGVDIPHEDTTTDDDEDD